MGKKIMFVKESVDFNNIKDKLILLSYTLEVNSKLNLLDQHLWSENFLSELLSLVYDLSFKNLNEQSSNFPGGDLVDYNSKIVVQVSTNTSKSKIDSTVEKISTNQLFLNYEIWFVALVTNKPTKINKKVRYINLNILLKDIQNLPLDKISKIRVLCDRSLRVSFFKNNKIFDITRIISILSTMQMTMEYEDNPNAFKIQDKIVYNKLEDLQDYINDFLVYERNVQSIYDEYDREGINKSLSVLNYINTKFLRVKSEKLLPKDLFFKLMDELKDDVIASDDYRNQSIEDLEFCLGIILVDAFVKCRIFDRPK